MRSNERDDAPDCQSPYEESIRRGAWRSGSNGATIRKELKKLTGVSNGIANDFLLELLAMETN
ncbi:MAG: hypothetical protein AB7V13_01230 [Pseudorhodoplanes sp.]